MQVNAGRLNLKSLIVGQSCTIATGTSSVRLIHLGTTVDFSLYLKGVGQRPILEDRLLRIENVKGQYKYWLHLDKLAPRRLYTVLVTGRSEDGMPGWQISDDTPGREPYPGEAESGGQSWGLLGKLLGGRKG